eukprot:353182-Chlamydomonas_euryale.AAC.62
MRAVTVRAGAPQHALAVLDQVADGNPNAMSKHLFDAAISVCATQFLAKEAWCVFESMAKAGFHPDVQSCNMVIAAFSHGGDVAGVMRVLDDMEERRIKPNEYTGMSALQACLYKRAGRHEDAVCLVERLVQSSGRPASAEVADALLSVCEAAMDKSEGVIVVAWMLVCANAFRIEHARRLWYQVATHHKLAPLTAPGAGLDGAVAAFNSLRPLKLHACTRAYNALLRACAKRGHWQQAQVLYDEMLEHESYAHYWNCVQCQAEIKADTATLNSLIKACLTGGALQNALGIFEWMVSGKRVADDIPADIETYNTLIRACHQYIGKWRPECLHTLDAKIVLATFDCSLAGLHLGPTPQGSPNGPACHKLFHFRILSEPHPLARAKQCLGSNQQKSEQASASWCQTIQLILRQRGNKRSHRAFKEASTQGIESQKHGSSL